MSEPRKRTLDELRNILVPPHALVQPTLRPSASPLLPLRWPVPHVARREAMDFGSRGDGSSDDDEATVDGRSSEATVEPPKETEERFERKDDAPSSWRRSSEGACGGSAGVCSGAAHRVLCSSSTRVGPSLVVSRCHAPPVSRDP